MLSTGDVVIVPSGISLLSIGLASLIVSLHSVNGSASAFPKKQRSLQHFFVCFKERERSNCNFGSPRCECVCFLGVYQVTVYILYGQYKCVFLGLCIWRMGWMFLDHPEKHLIHK